MMHLQMASTTSQHPHVWDHTLEVLQRYTWIDAGWSLLMLLVPYFVGRIAAWPLLRALKRWSRHTANLADDALAEHLPEPLKVVVPALALYGAMPFVSLPDELRDSLGHGVLVVVIAASRWLAYRSLRTVEDVVGLRYDFKAADNVRTRQSSSSRLLLLLS